VETPMAIFIANIVTIRWATRRYQTRRVNYVLHDIFLMISLYIKMYFRVKITFKDCRINRNNRAVIKLSHLLIIYWLCTNKYIPSSKSPDVQ
jgi:hypothetical protein